ncbi:unnamed protein product [Paramecium octaurelia]|uniref:Uncharacterized protein n=1 Tax=Paramecium octaurelia TaxID=43137 RepID=A0A8S1VZD7_PAROT|nr:unnamed protein product [Paramecium octaurelia]
MLLVSQLIYIHLLQRTEVQRVFQFQTEIIQTMRITLIDLLIDLCIHFQLMDETFESFDHLY